MLSDLWGLSWDVGQSISPALGGDGMAAYLAQTCLMRGDGRDVRAAIAPAVPALLVNPNVPCPTAAVYDRFDEQGGGSEFALTKLPKFDSPSRFIKWLKDRTRNDLEPPAVSLVPEIANVLKALEVTDGCQLARMSGSGATCFGLFATMAEARAAEEIVSEKYSDWWVKVSMLGGVG